MAREEECSMEEQEHAVHSAGDWRRDIFRVGVREGNTRRGETTRGGSKPAMRWLCWRILCHVGCMNGVRAGVSAITHCGVFTATYGVLP